MTNDLINRLEPSVIHEILKEDLVVFQPPMSNDLVELISQIIVQYVF